jgi:hypothetical protein
MGADINGSNMKKWYFDAWDVLDGLAFTSKRSAELIDADHTVFFSVPELEPVPVGRISTGLLATRFNFQQGFRNREGEEIGFDSLDQVREAVRRGYLAGGIGPGPVGPPQESVPPGGDSPGVQPGSLGADGGQYYEIQLAHQSADPIRSKDYSQLADEQKRADLLKDLQEPSSVAVLWNLLRGFAEATILEWLQRFPDDLRAGSMWNAVCQWGAALVSMQLWQQPDNEVYNNLSAFTVFRPVEMENLRTVTYALGYMPFTRALMSPKIESSLLFVVPCPLRREWHTSIRTLSDKLFLALSTRDYFRTNNHLPEFIPALLASMFMTLSNSRTPVITMPGPRPDLLLHERVRLVSAALRWLEKELPQLALPEEAEEALEEFAWNRLTPPGR